MVHSTRPLGPGGAVIGRRRRRFQLRPRKTAGRALRQVPASGPRHPPRVRSSAPLVALLPALLAPAPSSAQACFALPALLGGPNFVQLPTSRPMTCAGANGEQTTTRLAAFAE